MAVMIETNAPEETWALGRLLGEHASPGDVLCLDGDLGAGKTVFAKGFACGLGIEEPVVSPTFTILQVYGSGRMPFYHFDAYRIEDPEEMTEVGFEEYLYGEGASLVEWSSQVPELIPGDAVRIGIRRVAGRPDSCRQITLDGLPEGMEARVRAFVSGLPEEPAEAVQEPVSGLPEEP
ncbi:MAG: tRNA (adenosine(37)-N6)-threonylcarbamoyltransferase complex ATPase subunit type 1 TsaE, partial [Lachnospiraceae bacterium]|nr:tRNA (adenosine(37)-N6)-threonylcarbamoyltransferase complex ATPase subunit type 1 TsaE [Lachnospiraceae bacterium]